MAETPGMARKRKRVELDVTDAGARSFVHEARSSSDFSVSTTSKDVVEISDANPEAKFIKISNTSADKVISITSMMFSFMHCYIARSLCVSVVC